MIGSLFQSQAKPLLILVLAIVWVLQERIQPLRRRQRQRRRVQRLKHSPHCRLLQLQHLLDFLLLHLLQLRYPVRIHLHRLLPQIQPLQVLAHPLHLQSHRM